MEESYFQLKRPLIEKLARMYDITAAIRNQTEEEEVTWDDALMAECRSLRQELVPAFLPLVKVLVDAGLLTMTIELGDEDLSQYSSIAGEAIEVFDNGNIWIDCEASHWVFKPGAGPTDAEINNPTAVMPRRRRKCNG